MSASLLPNGAFTGCGTGSTSLPLSSSASLEAVPYLLPGTFGSGLVEVFVDRDQMSRWVSNQSCRGGDQRRLHGHDLRSASAAWYPLTRRLFKGLPLSAGISFCWRRRSWNPS
ncbi:MAG: hypothetical protein IPP55_17030 [Anaerolineales bacterium]|nr:hypothetical protein [Anaerolineales bacterium]